MIPLGSINYVGDRNSLGNCLGERRLVGKGLLFGRSRLDDHSRFDSEDLDGGKSALVCQDHF